MEFYPKDIDTYSTITNNQRTEIKVKGSRFIATVAHTTDLEASAKFLEQIRAEYYDATHNCYAYRIGWDGNLFRAADDGEPAGSAGKPILFTLDKFNFQDVAVVVTRYFGGTKLGVGGLVRAYSESAEEALKLCTPKIIHRTKTLSLTCSYEELSFAKRMLDDYAVRYDEQYTDKIQFLANIPISKVDLFISQLFSLSQGKLIAYKL
jgi:uncharacterized YigZ family protein